MAWDYFCCSKGHMYRVKKAHKGSPHVMCPFCNSTWKFKTLKREWTIWRNQFFGENKSVLGVELKF